MTQELESLTVIFLVVLDKESIQSLVSLSRVSSISLSHEVSYSVVSQTVGRESVRVNDH